MLEVYSDGNVKRATRLYLDFNILPDYVGLGRLFHVVLERIIRGNNVNK